MHASAPLLRNLEHDIVGLHWLLAHRPDQVRVFDERAAQVGTGHDIYFTGEGDAAGVAEALRELAVGTLIHAPQEWLGVINAAWQGRVSQIRCAEWKRDPDTPLPAQADNVAEARPLRAADVRKLGETGLERLVTPYRDAEEFLELSFGFGVVQQNKVVSACTAFYVADGAADLATETYTSLRSNGFGGAVLLAAVRETLRRGLQPQIHASACNEPVERLAARLGFEGPASYVAFARQG
jgi:hypothetical protein